MSWTAPTRVGGAQNYGSAFLPAIYQGTAIGHIGAKIPDAKISNVSSNHRPISNASNSISCNR